MSIVTLWYAVYMCVPLPPSFHPSPLSSQVGLETLFEQLHSKMEGLDGGRFHTLSQGLREEVERLSRKEHRWEPYNVDQLVCVCVCVCEHVCVCVCEYV